MMIIADRKCLSDRYTSPDGLTCVSVRSIMKPEQVGENGVGPGSFLRRCLIEPPDTQTGAAEPERLIGDWDLHDRI